jgi:hypothetical protein
MQSSSTPVIAACLVIFTATHAYGVGGTITDGNVDFTIAASGFDTSPSANFRVPNAVAVDHVFEQGWWYRVAGGTQETFFPVPTTESYVANTATLTWTNVNAQNFDASALATIRNVGVNMAIVQIEMTITNNSGANLNLNLFHFADLDVGGTAGGDSATLINANDHIGITDVATTGEYRGLGATALLVRPFSGATDVAALLSDVSVNNFDNTTLPFGPGDFTGGFQWVRTIPTGGKSLFVVLLAINTPAVPATGSCCVPGTGCVPDQLAGQCSILGGTFNGVASTCSPNPCISSCCLPTPACVHLNEADCQAMGGAYNNGADNCNDNDGDGFANVCETCIDDSAKVIAGVCGCGVPDTDTDADGTLDCNDACPNDPLKIAAGACGCGVADTDANGNGTPDCNDVAAANTPAGQPAPGCGTGASSCAPATALPMSLLPLVMIGWKRRTNRRSR